MSYINQATLLGNLGQDPELIKKTEQGCFVSFSLATNKKFTDKMGAVVEQTEWHKVFANNALGNYVLTYGKKGAKVLVMGELRTTKYKDKQGQERLRTAVYAKEVHVLFPPAAKQEANASATNEASVGTDEAVPADGPQSAVDNTPVNAA